MRLNPVQKRSRLNTLIIHIICWMIFITYELSIVYYSFGKLDKFYDYVIYYMINITFFYAYIRTLNFTFNYHHWRFFQGLLIYLLLLAVYILIKGIADALLSGHQIAIHDSYIWIQQFFPRTISRSLYFTVLATFYWSAGHISYFRKQAIEAEQHQLIVEKDKAELKAQLLNTQAAYLQQQINPHMLFNTLNFVYGSVQPYSEEAAHSVWLLAEIMRFSLEGIGADGKVDLSAEIDQIHYLLEINAYRYPVDVKLLTNGNFKEYRIIPLILLTLTENIFKHGDLSVLSDPATLYIDADDEGKMIFRTRNLKKAKNDRYNRSQLGLQNIRIRMDAAYADHYQLHINESEHHFELTLTMNL